MGVMYQGAHHPNRIDMGAKPLDPDTKARAMARLIAGERPVVIAKELGIAKSTVSRWITNAPKKAAEAQVIRDYGEKLGLYLDELLETAIAQQRFFRDQNWLRLQPAGELAVLHGVCVDKGIRLFEASARANAAQAEKQGELPGVVQVDSPGIVDCP